MTKIFITGATGFVGGHLRKHLIEKGHQVYSATREEIGDPFSPDPWRIVLERSCPDAVVHLIAKTHADDAANPAALESYRHINVDITRAVLTACNDIGIKRFIYLSSIKAVGEETPIDCPFTEESPCHPEDCYGITKREAEELVMQNSRTLNAVILRPPLIYGPGVKGNFLKLLKAVKMGIPLPFASIKNARSLLFVGNLTHAIEILTQLSIAGGALFHIADQEAPSTPEILRLFASALNVKSRMLPFPPYLLEIMASALGQLHTVRKLTRSLVVSSQRIVLECAFSHQFGFNAGLTLTMHDSSCIETK